MGWFKREDPLVSASAADLETASNEQGAERHMSRIQSEPSPSEPHNEADDGGGDMRERRSKSTPAESGADVEKASESSDGVKQLDELTPDELKAYHRLKSLVHYMDNGVRVPIVGYRFGMDAIVGVIPYAGDAAGALVGSYIMAKALQFHMPRRLVAHMAVNQAIDCCVGIVPFLGDIFDCAFKANTRNLKLLDAHLSQPRAARRADTCFLCGVFFVVVVMPFLLVLGVLGGIIVAILAAVGVIR